jgi:hypothetical protein
MILPGMSSARRAALAALLLLSAGRAGPLAAQRLDWATLATFYGDNTEFFTPYRVGETILGAQFRSALVFHPGRRTAVHFGVFGDHRAGSDRFLDPVKPVLSFRYATGTGTGVMGTLVTEGRHGFLEPLEVTTLEFTRPVEYGVQWIERRRHWRAEGFLDWQKVNLPGQREVFDYGWVVAVRPVPQLSLEHQLHGVHHGGQLYDVGPVTNNVASGVGVVVSDTLPRVGRASLALWRLRSSGDANPADPPGRPGTGHGWYLRAGVAPRGWFELFSISWWGTDYLANEGDNNYNSLGADPAFWRSHRKYWELGLIRRSRIERDLTFDGEFRLHRIDNLSSIAIGRSKWEYSYRLVVRAPLSVPIRTAR